MASEPWPVLGRAAAGAEEELARPYTSRQCDWRRLTVIVRVVGRLCCCGMRCACLFHIARGPMTLGPCIHCHVDSSYTCPRPEIRMEDFFASGMFTCKRSNLENLKIKRSCKLIDLQGRIHPQTSCSVSTRFYSRTYFSFSSCLAAWFSSHRIGRSNATHRPHRLVYV